MVDKFAFSFPDAVVELSHGSKTWNCGVWISTRKACIENLTYQSVDPANSVGTVKFCSVNHKTGQVVCDTGNTQVPV